MRVLVAYNPTAGDDGREDVRETLAALELAGHDVTEQSVQDEGWQEMLRLPVDLVVAAGGDGTVGQVFKELAGTVVPVAIVPIGSANNVARSLELLKGRQAHFDISSLTWSGGSTTFVESCGGGVFAEMVARAEDAQEHPSGEDKVEFGLRLLLDAVAAAAPREWRVDADGRDLSGDYIAVEVLNIAMLGPNVPLAPHADPGDGLLDLVLVRAGDAEALAAYARARLESDPEPRLRLETHRAREVILRPPPRLPLRLDDELLESFGDSITAAVSANVALEEPPGLV
jgi:diacylglycerol kinase (ATP)